MGKNRNSEIYFISKKIEDLIIAGIAFPIVVLIVSLLSTIHLLTYRSNPFFISQRVGKNNKIFKLIKLKTMHDFTPLLSTSELKNANFYLTGLGKILRKYSLDELPQIFNVLKGDMSIVGPRPSLYSQVELNVYRTKRAISDLSPGITGLSQVIYRDQASDKLKGKIDRIYQQRMSICLDLWIIFKTIQQLVFPVNVRH